MFRAKITLTFALLTALLVLGVYIILNGQVQRAFEQDAEVALLRAATLAEQSLRLDEASLYEKARYTAQKPSFYRTMKVDENPELFEQLKEEYPDARTPDGARHVKVYDDPLKVDEVYFEGLKQAKDAPRTFDLSLNGRNEGVPVLYAVLDANGKAVAGLGKDRRRWWGDNIAQQFPAVLSVVKENRPQTAVWNWAWSSSEIPEDYRVVIVPVSNSVDRAAVGVVVAGKKIDKGLADSIQRLIVGNPEAEKSRSTMLPQVVFFRGEKIIGATLTKLQQDSLSRVAFAEDSILKEHRPEQVRVLQIDQQPFLAAVRFFADEFGSAPQPTGFMVLSPLADAHRPVSLAMTNIMAIALAVLLIGIILLLVFIQTFVKPIGRIEAGLGEILAGNKDYVFEVEEKNSTFGHILQGLNLVSAFLQGKPMPDDADGQGDWSELMGADSAAAPAAAPSAVVGVAMPGMKPRPAQSDGNTGDKDDSAKGDTPE